MTMDVIIMPDGKREIVGSPRDMCDLMNRYMGEDAVKWWKEYLHEHYMEDNERAKVEDDMYKTLEITRERYRNVLLDIEEDAEELEEVNASEDKEAHWIERRTWMECSRCGNEFSIRDHDYCNLTKYDFCPCCGSWMHEKAAR